MSEMQFHCLTCELPPHAQCLVCRSDTQFPLFKQPLTLTFNDSKAE